MGPAGFAVVGLVVNPPESEDDDAWVLSDDAVDFLESLLLKIALNTTMTTTTPPMMASVFQTGVGLAGAGAVGGGGGGTTPARCSVHAVPSQYRCCGAPDGSGYQPGGVGVVMSGDVNSKLPGFAQI